LANRPEEFFFNGRKNFSSTVGRIFLQWSEEFFFKCTENHSAAWPPGRLAAWPPGGNSRSAGQPVSRSAGQPVGIRAKGTVENDRQPISVASGLSFRLLPIP
jgi:hypothetical protein